MKNTMNRRAIAIMSLVTCMQLSAGEAPAYDYLPAGVIMIERLSLQESEQKELQNSENGYDADDESVENEEDDMAVVENDCEFSQDEYISDELGEYEPNRNEKIPAYAYCVAALMYVKSYCKDGAVAVSDYYASHIKPTLKNYWNRYAVQRDA